MSQCGSLSRQQPSNSLQMHTSNYYKLPKKKIENGTNEIHGSGHVKKNGASKES